MAGVVGLLPCLNLVPFTPRFIQTTWQKGRAGRSPLRQSACRQAAEVLEQLGYPAAWAATVDLERLKHRTWSKTRSDASTLTLLSPCAKASRKTLQTLKQQEQQTRL